MNRFKSFFRNFEWRGFLIGVVVALLIYTTFGVGTRVDTIKKMATVQSMTERNWKVLRYEGYQWGSWARHGGYCWYHVANIDNPNIQYRVRISLWNGELQYWYGEPEKLNRFNVDVSNSQRN